MRIRNNLVFALTFIILHNDLDASRDVTGDEYRDNTRADKRRLRNSQRVSRRKDRQNLLESDEPESTHDIPVALQPLIFTQGGGTRYDDISASRGDVTHTVVTSQQPSGHSAAEVKRARIRARELRLFQIQLELFGRLRGNPHGTAVDQGFLDPEEFMPFIPSTPDPGQSTRIFTPQLLHSSCSKPDRADDSWYTSEQFRLFFEVERGMVPNGDPSSNLTSAILKLYKHAYRSGQNSNTMVHRSKRSQHNQAESTELLDDGLTVTVYQYNKAPRLDKSNRSDRTTIIDAKAIAKQHEGFIQLDIKKAVQFWSESPRRNYGLVVKVVDSSGNTINATQMFHTTNCSEDSQSNNPNTNEPSTFPHSSEPKEASIIVVKEELPVLDSRHKRHIDSGDTTSTSRRGKSRKRYCAISEIRLSFKELGLDWILQPQTFTYRQCQGTCNTVPKRRAIRDRYGKNLDKYDWMNKDDGEETGCCGPTAMAPLSVIHIDEHSVIHYSILHDFIITECGCRS